MDESFVGTFKILPLCDVKWLMGLGFLSGGYILGQNNKHKHRVSFFQLSNDCRSDDYSDGILYCKD